MLEHNSLITFSCNGCLIAARTRRAHVDVRALRSRLLQRGVAILRLHRVDLTKVLSAERTLQDGLPRRLLVVSPDLHALDVGALTTTKPERSNKT